MNHGSGAPCADCSRNHGDDVEEIEGAPLEVLAGDVFERLPARPQVDAIAHLGVARHRAYALIGEVTYQLRNRVWSDHRVGIDADIDLFVHDAAARS